MEFLWIALTAGWLLLMTWLSHQSGPETARESEALARELRPLLPGRDLETANYLLRKAAHVGVFAVLAVLVSGTWNKLEAPLPRWGLYGALLLWCWVDEATKPLVPGRHFSWLDVGLNGAGVALGTAFWALLSA